VKAAASFESGEASSNLDGDLGFSLKSSPEVGVTMLGDLA